MSYVKLLDDFFFNDICILSRDRRGLTLTEFLLCAGHHLLSQLEEELSFQFGGLETKDGETEDWSRVM